MTKKKTARKSAANKTVKKVAKTKIVGINMKEEMANELKRRAESMNISVAKYCKIILSQWLESGKKIMLREK